jgi:hypothetical protein
MPQLRDCKILLVLTDTGRDNPENSYIYTT